MVFTSKYYTEVGWLKIVGSENHIFQIKFEAKEFEADKDLPEIYFKLKNQLDSYFIDKEWKFDIPLLPKGTEFQQKVWSELLKIPFSETVSYQKIAQNLGDEKLIRAAANANGKNPIAILIPCHRVIGKDGSLTGYAGGLNRKKFLINLEKGINDLTLF